MNPALDPFQHTLNLHDTLTVHFRLNTRRNDGAGTGSRPWRRANPIDETGLCLLSLDGGGVRDLSMLYILKGLMTRLNHERQQKGLPAVKPCEVFDLREAS
jgi:hypothetical protein